MEKQDAVSTADIKHAVSGLSTPDKRADRILVLRTMTGQSRSAFERYGIARGTLQNWETARFGGLTATGAEKLSRAAAAEGIDCAASWLMHGVGYPPQFVATQKASQQVSYANDEVFLQELMHFRGHYPQAVHHVISDESMLPQYAKGDFVAGVRRFTSDIDTVIGMSCIVHVVGYGTMVRRVMLGDIPTRYHLIANNHLVTGKHPMLFNVELMSAAPVIWWRRPAPV